jgi:hypothetical protein
VLVCSDAVHDGGEEYVILVKTVNCCGGIHLVCCLLLCLNSLQMELFLNATSQGEHLAQTEQSANMMTIISCHEDMQKRRHFKESGVVQIQRQNKNALDFTSRALLPLVSLPMERAARGGSCPVARCRQRFNQTLDAQHMGARLTTQAITRESHHRC